MRYNRKVFPVAVIITTSLFATSAKASWEGWKEITYGVESAGDWAAQNDIGSAAGRYQITLENWRRLEYVEPLKPGQSTKDWGVAVFTDKAKAMGVSSYSDLMNTDYGKNVQNAAVTDLATGMWNGLNSNTKSYIGSTVHGVQTNEATLMGATWFLGEGAMNSWAASGFTAEGLASLDNWELIKKYNPTIASSPEALQEYLIGRMKQFEGVDISDLTGGTVTNTTDVMVCDTYISETMKHEAISYIDQIAAAAQDENIGFSQLQGTFGELSCIEFAFDGGLDVMFSVPNLNDIKDQAMQMACQEVNTMVSDATGNLTGALSEITSFAADVPGFGPFQGIGGVSTSWNPNLTGEDRINVGIDNAGAGGTGSVGGGIGGGTSGIGGPASFNPSGSTGLDALFQ